MFRRNVFLFPLLIVVVLQLMPVSIAHSASLIDPTQHCSKI
jgi:hypothetical protein